MSERKSQWELFLEEEADLKPKEKRCPRCKKYKPFSEYHKCKKEKLGIMSACKECESKRRKKCWYRDPVDRFWKFYHAHTMRVGDCLEWTAAYANGYPTYKWQKQPTTVGRLVYRFSVGDTPDDMYVLITCNNKRCVRHSHLKLATRLEVEIKRRNTIGNRGKSLRGVDRPNAKITEDDVRVIRDRYNQGDISQRKLARQMGISREIIQNVLAGRTWKHVQ